MGNLLIGIWSGICSETQKQSIDCCFSGLAWPQDIHAREYVNDCQVVRKFFCPNVACSSPSAPYECGFAI
jgi:hypothetical protein